MKRIQTLSLALVLSTTLILALTATPAHAFIWKGPCVGFKNGQTLRKDTAHDIKEIRNRRLIRCVFNTFAPGELSTALYVAERESNFDPWAWNHAIYREHDCLGTFQHMRAYWHARVLRYLKPWWFPRSWPDVSAFDPRANAIVTAKMARSGGWSPWSTAP